MSMRASLSWLNSLIVVLILSGSFFIGTADSGAQGPGEEHKVAKGLSDKVKSAPSNEKVRVIIRMKKSEGRFGTHSAKKSVKEDVLKGGGKVKYEYSLFDGMAAEVPAAKLAALAKNPNVELIVEDRQMRASLTESVPLINADDVWREVQAGLNTTGKGQTICVIDSGVDYNHPDLGGGKGAGFKVLGGYDFVNGDSDPFDDYGHGTHVAGIAAANGTLKGVAPDANIIAIKSLGSSGLGLDSWILAGIDWCVNNASAYNITVISMSLGGYLYSSYCDNEVGETSFRDSIDAAVAQNITVVASTGNDANYTNISSPACIQNATRVGATYDKNVGSKAWISCTDSSTAADQITCFTNRGPGFPDMLLAPGAMTNSTNMSSGYSEKGGTSMAAPHVSGLIALLNQKYKTSFGTNPTPNYLFSVMNSTGVSIDDSSKTGNVYSRIDALAAYNNVTDAAVPTTTASPAGGTYPSEVAVTLAADENATIYYDYNVTVNGITRNDKSSFNNIYSGPIGITTNTTLGFYAVDSAGNNESLKTENYTIEYLYPHEFYDDFEIEKHWVMNEEMVNLSCYKNDSSGEVNRSDAVKMNGSYGMCIWPNKNGTSKSNHVIGGKKLSDVGRGGKWLYELYAYIDPANNDTGQTGPEFSVQNTREVNSGVFNLTIAGFQYVANPSAPEFGLWRIWNETAPGNASWNNLTNKTLESGVWYHIGMEFDFDTNYYSKFWVNQSGTNLIDMDISTHKIAEEKRWNEAGFSVTLEAENMYDGCGTGDPTNYTVYYDNISLKDIDPPSIAIISPQNDSYSSENITLNVTTGEYANVTYSLNSGANASMFNESTTGNTTITAVEGPNNITVYALDAAGGNLNSSSVDFTVDTIPPAVTNLSITPANPFEGQLVNLSVNVTDTSTGVYNVSFNITYPTGASGLLETQKDGDLYKNESFNASQFGVYIVQVVANDSAGNINGSVSKNFSVIRRLANNTIIQNGSSAPVINNSLLMLVATAKNESNATVNVTAEISTNASHFNLEEVNATYYKTYRYLNLTNYTDLSNLSSINISVPYSGENLTGILEDTLSLHYWNGSNWTKLRDYANSSIPGGPFVFDAGVSTAEDYVWAAVDHFSKYSVSGLKDTDNDSIADLYDDCPTQAETVNGYQDSDGCPDTGPSQTPSGGGGGSADPKITVSTSEGKVQITISYLPANKETAVTIPSTENMPLSNLGINVNKKVSSVEMTITTLDEKPENVSEAPSGVVSDYIQIDTKNIEDADINNVTNAFKVPLSWIEDNGIDKEKVALNRYADDRWNTLETSKTEEDSDYVHYSAVSPGLSVFGISGKSERKEVTIPQMPITAQTVAPATTAPPTAAPATAPAEEKSKLPLIVIAILSIVIITATAYYWFAMQKSKEKDGAEEEEPKE